MTVINPVQIDMWFGVGTAISIWENTKKLGGYVSLFNICAYPLNSAMTLPLDSLTDSDSLRTPSIKFCPESGHSVVLTCSESSLMSSLVH